MEKRQDRNADACAANPRHGPVVVEERRDKMILEPPYTDGC